MNCMSSTLDSNAWIPWLAPPDNKPLCVAVMFYLKDLMDRIEGDYRLSDVLLLHKV